MKTTLLVSLLAVTIRRDANTITPITVPAHELPMLRNMFGKENVTQADEPVGSVEVDPAGEYERLSAKYGAGKVAKVYGDDDGLRLSEMVAKNEVKGEPVKKLTKAEQKAADEAAQAAGGPQE
ncbi:MAG: hypothetical protein ACRC7C_19635 [Beijerinckiaceae bacterium]